VKHFALGEPINDGLTAWTDGSHLDEQAVEEFNAFFWAKNPNCGRL
jgi:hypothetical protein